jgi:hypothetical protein
VQLLRLGVGSALCRHVGRALLHETGLSRPM